MSTAAAVRITSFGHGRSEYKLLDRPTTVKDALESTGLEVERRRLAVNGLPAGLETGLREGDELTLIPHLQGG